jgi:hypothetical protein
LAGTRRLGQGPAVQGLAFFSTVSLLDRRFGRTREPVAAARLYLDRLVTEARGVRAAVVADERRLVAGAGLPVADLSRIAAVAEDAAQGTDALAPAPGPAPRGDLFVHRIRVRGREHLFVTLGGRARRVRDVERDLARILGA